MKSFTKIDLGRLEIQAAEQEELMGQATKRAARLKKRHADAEAELEVTEAEVKRRIRKRPGKYGLARAVEAAVKEAMVVTPEYQDAYRKVRKAKYAQDMADAVVKRLEHRKRMIEVEVQLFGLGYFAKPNTKKGGDKYHEAATHDAFRRKRKDKRVLDEDEG